MPGTITMLLGAGLVIIYGVNVDNIYKATTQISDIKATLGATSCNSL
jgi:hypothetical protein